MKKKLLSLLVSSMLVGSVWAAPTTLPEKTSAVEALIYGTTEEGSLVDRVERLEKAVFGASKHGDLPDRVNGVYEAVDMAKTGMSLREKIDALQWNYSHEITKEPLISRIEAMETNIWGKTESGSLSHRQYNLETAIMGDDRTLSMKQATLLTTDVFKITLEKDLSTKLNKEGDTFVFKVTQDVLVGDVLLVAKGTTGEGHITALKKGRSFGRSAKMEMVFDKVTTVDGTEFAVEQGLEAQEKTKTELGAAGASVAGVALLGPVGLVGGFFVKGKDIEYPSGTTFYVQPLIEVTSYGPVMGGVPIEKPVKKPENPVTSTAKEVPVQPIPTDNPVTPAKDIESGSKAAETAQAATIADVKEAVKAIEAEQAATTEKATEAVKEATTTSESEDVPNEPIIVIKRTE